MGNKLEQIKDTIEKDLDKGYQVLDRGFEHMKVTIDRDLDAGFQVLDRGFENAKITIDKDLDKFMKTVAFFQR